MADNAGNRGVQCTAHKGRFHRSDRSVTIIVSFSFHFDRLSGLAARVPGYRSRGSDSIPALLDFLRNSGFGTGSTQPSEYN
jgi:hypothetical protein